MTNKALAFASLLLIASLIPSHSPEARNLEPYSPEQISSSCPETYVLSPFSRMCILNDPKAIEYDELHHIVTKNPCRESSFLNKALLACTRVRNMTLAKGKDTSKTRKNVVLQNGKAATLSINCIYDENRQQYTEIIVDSHVGNIIDYIYQNDELKWIKDGNTITEALPLRYP